MIVTALAKEGLKVGFSCTLLFLFPVVSTVSIAELGYYLLKFIDN